MEFINKILSFFVKKITGSSALLNIGDNQTKTITNNKELSDINISHNSGNVNFAGRDIDNETH